MGSYPVLEVTAITRSDIYIYIKPSVMHLRHIKQDMVGVARERIRRHPKLSFSYFIHCTFYSGQIECRDDCVRCGSGEEE